MKKLIFNLTLICGFSLFTGGCDFEMDVTPEPPSAKRWVSGVLSERDSGKKIVGMEVYAWECTFCWDEEEGCPEDYSSAKTKEDGTFTLTYSGPSKFGFSYYHSLNPKYHHFSVNGIDGDSVFGPLCVNVEDSVFLDVKLW